MTALFREVLDTCDRLGIVPDLLQVIADGIVRVSTFRHPCEPVLAGRIGMVTHVGEHGGATVDVAEGCARFSCHVTVAIGTQVGERVVIPNGDYVRETVLLAPVAEAAAH